MRCFKCLKEVPNGSEVCPHCGQVLVPKAGKQNNIKNDLASTQVKQREYQIGDTIKDRYEVRGILGKKGTGFTYKVRDKEKKKTFVLKQIQSFLITSEGAKQTFYDIVKKIINLNTGEVAAIQDYGEDNGTVYIVTEYVEGLTLRKLLGVRKEMKQFFKGEELESILTQVCKVLILAHNNGIVHGDLKPENIFILPNGLKITELGITASFSPLDFTSIQQDLGDAYKYIAPEVVIGGALSKASDIYSLGVIVYEMLTGIIPAGVVNPPTNYNSELPEKINGVLLKALEQDPDQRTQYVSEFYNQLITCFGLKPASFDEKPWETKQVAETEQTGKLQTEIDEELLMYIEAGQPEKPAEPLVIQGEEKQTQVTPVPPVEKEAKPAEQLTVESVTEKPISEAEISAEEVKPVVETEHPEVSSAEEKPLTAKPPIAESKKEIAKEEPLTKKIEEEKLIPVQEIPAEEKEKPPVWTPEVTPPPSATEVSAEKLEQKGIEQEEQTNLEDIARHLESVTEEIQGAHTKTTITSPPVEEKTGTPAVESRQPVIEQPVTPRIEPERVAPSTLQPPGVPVQVSKEKRSYLPIISGAAIVVIGALAIVVWLLLKTPSKEVSSVTPIKPAKQAEVFTQPSNANVMHVTETAEVTKPQQEPRVTQVQEEKEKKVERPKPEKKVAVVVPKPPPPKCPEDMVYIPGGSFIMGSSPSDPLRDFSEKPDVKVYVKSFCIDKYEYPNREGYTPKTSVSYYTAEKLCEDEGKQLCTEEEWEKACKGPSELRYPYGNVWNASKCNTQNSDGTNRAIAPSGSYKGCVSGYGVYDLSGNVMEWTKSVFSSEDTEDRVVKGGSYTKPDWATRCAYRYNMLPNSTSNEVGFRCCRAVEK